MTCYNILLVEDKKETATRTKNLLQAMKPEAFGETADGTVDVRLATSQREADYEVSRSPQDGFDMILLDLSYPTGPDDVPDLPGKFNGMVWLPQLRRLQPDATIVVLTAHATENGLENAITAVRDYDADDVIPKTLSWGEIRARIKLAVEHAMRRKQSNLLTGELFRSLLHSRASRTLGEDISTRVSELRYSLGRLADQIESGDPSAITGMPEQIRSELKSLDSDIKSLSERLQGGAEKPQQISDCCEFVRGVAQIYRQFLVESDVTVNVEPAKPSVSVTTYIGDLKLALQEVIQNAIDSFRESTAPSVRPRKLEFNADLQNQFARITVSDNGDGFSADALHHKFELGFTTRAPRSGEGSHSRGMGLYIARRMLQGLGGDISVANRREGGAIVVLTVRNLASHESGNSGYRQSVGAIADRGD
jgi:signal transduction histidine kinase